MKQGTLRAMLLYLFDQLEENSKFIKLLKNNQFLTQEACQRLTEKIKARNQVLVEEEQVKKGCNHIIDVTGNNVSIFLLEQQVVKSVK